jgi:4-hydroxy-4-methyl-2-oxoglutarate aldolase
MKVSSGVARTAIELASRALRGARRHATLSYSTTTWGAGLERMNERSFVTNAVAPADLTNYLDGARLGHTSLPPIPTGASPLVAHSTCCQGGFKPMMFVQELEALAGMDSPTVANAIEAYGVRDATTGYASMELRHLCPESGVMLGYALTCLSDSTSPGPRRPTKEHELFEALANAPKPTVVVMKDVSSDRLRSCHAGDVLCSIFRRLGAVGVVTDGAVRDVSGIRERVPGFHVFAAGLVVSHGTSTIVEIGGTVSICGLSICQGDLLHGDDNGLLQVPTQIAARIADQSRLVHEKERDLLRFVNGNDFNLSDLKLRMSPEARHKG